MSNSLIDDAEKAIREGDSDLAIERLYSVIAKGDDFGRIEVSKAYALLGHVCRLLAPQVDGGHNGLGFYCASLLHDPTNADARKSVIDALAEGGPSAIPADPLLARMFS